MFVTTEMPGMAAAAAVPGVPLCDVAFQDAATEQAARLRAEAEGSVAGLDLNVTFVHARGDVAAELLRIAHDLQADQIVVGRSTKLRHRLVGALGRKLVAKRAAPVVVIVP